MSAFNERLEDLRKRFTARCGERADQLELALSQGRREEVASIAHDIAGTGGIFGFADLSIEARSLDHLAKGDAPYENAARSMVLRLREIAEASA